MSLTMGLSLRPPREEEAEEAAAPSDTSSLGASLSAAAASGGAASAAAADTSLSAGEAGGVSGAAAAEVEEPLRSGPAEGEAEVEAVPALAFAPPGAPLERICPMSTAERKTTLDNREKSKNLVSGNNHQNFFWYTDVTELPGID